MQGQPQVSSGQSVHMSSTKVAVCLSIQSSSGGGSSNAGVMAGAALPESDLLSFSTAGGCLVLKAGGFLCL